MSDSMQNMIEASLHRSLEMGEMEAESASLREALAKAQQERDKLRDALDEVAGYYHSLAGTADHRLDDSCECAVCKIVQVALQGQCCGLRDYEQANLGPCPHCAGTGIRLNDTFVGHLVRTRRKAKHIMTKALAAKVGISSQYVTDLEQGRRNWSHYLADRCLMAIDMWEIDSDGDHNREAMRDDGLAR